MSANLIINLDIHISEEDHLDDAHKLNAKKKDKIDPVARLNDWIDEVDKKQKDLSHKARPPIMKTKDPGKLCLKYILSFLKNLKIP